jgi:predicted amidohydrolase YtcJ
MKNLIPILMLMTILESTYADAPKSIALRNGKVYTMDEANPQAEMVVCSGDKIVFVGSIIEGAKHLTPETKIIDLQGATVLPGLIDAHAHMNSLGKSLEILDLRGIETPQTITQLVIGLQMTIPKGEWITGRSWDQNDWPSKSFPSWRDLQGTEANPVYLIRVDGHAGWVNKTALKLCGIDKDTPDPPGGKILRDKKGNPTGIFLDNAMDLIEQKIPKPSVETIKKRLMNAFAECAENGLTGVGDAYIYSQSYQAYLELADEGKMTIRVYGMHCDSAEWLEDNFARGPLIGYGGGYFTARCVKMFADGALGSRGGLLFEPYSDDPGNCGVEISSEDSIQNVTKRAVKAGFQVAVHAIGDKANNNVLNAYQRALKEAPPSDYRLRIEHCQTLTAEDIPRFKELGVIASMQPTHCTSDMPWSLDRLGPERMKGAYAWRSLKNAGAVLAFGSDFPVEEVNPFWGIYSAVTGKDLQGNPPGGWYPEQCLTVQEALEGFTVGSAYAQFQEDKVGRIKAGFYADFTIIDRDIFDIPVKEIPKTKVIHTIVGGRVVYSSFTSKP